ncbi:MAG: cellulase family glycosylhydrolase [Chloroflexota bacterium]
MTSRAFRQRFLMVGLVAPLLLTVLSLAGWRAAPASARPAAAQDIPDNPYGVNVFLHKEVEEWKIEQTLRMIAEANITWIKQEFSWQEIEFKKGYFFDDKWNKSSWEKFDRIVDLADKYKLKIIARVSHPPAWAASTDGTGPLNNNKDMADFTNALLDHYKGRIQYVQMWNEPNLSAEWVPGKPVNPAGYAAMMKTVYPLVKAAHPDAVLLSAPLAISLEGVNLRGNMNDLDYWTGLYAAGIKGNFDIASANAYGLDQPPDAEPGPKALNFRRVELLRDIMVQNGDGDKSIWLNEYAWNASPETLSEEEKNYWRHVTPEQQASWTVQGVEYARANWPWAGVMSIWYFRQVGDVPSDKAEYYFRMVDPDFTPAPIYDAVKNDAMKYPGPASQPVSTPEFVPPTATSVPPFQGDTPTPVAPTETAVEATPTAAEGTTVTATPAGATATVTPGGASATPMVTGTAGPSATATAGTGTVAGESGGNTLLFVLGGVLVVAGLGGVGYWFMRGRQPAS